VPADGTSAAAEVNGDFGRSPIFGQLSVKLLLGLCKYMEVPDVKHKNGWRIKALKTLLRSTMAIATPRHQRDDLEKVVRGCPVRVISGYDGLKT